MAENDTIDPNPTNEAAVFVNFRVTERGQSEAVARFLSLLYERADEEHPIRINVRCMIKPGELDFAKHAAEEWGFDYHPSSDQNDSVVGPLSDDIYDEVLGEIAQLVEEEIDEVNDGSTLVTVTERPMDAMPLWIIHQFCRMVATDWVQPMVERPDIAEMVRPDMPDGIKQYLSTWGLNPTEVAVVDYEPLEL